MDNNILISHWQHGVWNETDNIFIDKTKTIQDCYKCDQCQKTATSRKMLRQHKDSVHNERKTFRCHVSSCMRSFTSANYLKNHVDIEHTDRTEACIPCPKKDCVLFFPNNYRLKRHIRHDHRQERLYQCQICARKFASVEVRNNHVNTKHTSAPLLDNFPMSILDTNYCRTDQIKESENGTVCAASPIGSKFTSRNGQRNVVGTYEAEWLTTSVDSNPILSTQIDRILLDIFSDKCGESLHSSDSGVVMHSLRDVDDLSKQHQLNDRSYLNPLNSTSSAPLQSTNFFHDPDSNMYTINSTLASQPYSSHNSLCHLPKNNIPSSQNYPQSNTESEDHSTESQRSFLVNSSQHEELSDISMDSHLKDVLLSVVNSFDNPIKLMEYSCLDNMFDDLHEVISKDTIHAHIYVNERLPLTAQKHHLLSLNNMHSKFLSRSQLDFSFESDTSSGIDVNPLLNDKTIRPQNGRTMTRNQYGSNEVIGKSQTYYNHGLSDLYIQPSDRSSYPAVMNGSLTPNYHYHQPTTTECMDDYMPQRNPYSNIYRRRVPPPYRSAGIGHQMLPSHQSSFVTPPIAYCSPSLMPRGSCFHPQNRRTLPLSAIRQQQPQPQQYRHLLCNQPIATESQGQQSNYPFTAAADDDNEKSLSKCEDSIVSNEQSRITTINCKHGSQIVNTLMKPSQNCDVTYTKAAVLID